LNALNGLTAQVQYFATGTSGTDFAISSATDTHTFNLPTASNTNRGALSSSDWTTFNNKVPASRTLTINGVAFDLSADRSWTVAGGISGSGAAGQVAYWTGASAQSGSNNLFWDNANGRLGIGTNAPARALDVRNTAIFTANASSYASVLEVENTGNAAVDNKNVAIFKGSRGNASNIDDNTNIGIQQKNNTVGNFGVFNFYNSLFNLTAFFGAEYSNHSALPTGNLIFGTVNSGTVAVKAKLYNTGNLLLQNGGTFTDSGERLQVTGTMKVTASGMFGTNTQSSGVRLETDGVFRAWTSVQLGQFGSGVLDTASFSKSTTGSDFFSFTNNSGFTATNGSYYFLRATSNVLPTSGTATFSLFLIQGTINQTGGANGITRGLYVNPTLTAAADFRAIETTNGKVIFGNLPTSSAGLPTGAIWNDAGTIKIV
jgi:hypothetical protein